MLDGEQLHHLRPSLFLVWIQLLVLCQQSGIFLFQRLDSGQLLQAQAVKIPLRRLAGYDRAGVFSVKFFLLFWSQFAILGIDLTGLEIGPDVFLQLGDFLHSLTVFLSTVCKFMVLLHCRIAGTFQIRIDQ